MNIKKITVICLMAGLLWTVFPTNSYAAEGDFPCVSASVADTLEVGTVLPLTFYRNAVSVYINGVPLYSDVAPINRNGRIYVPVRHIAEQLGCDVSYEFPGVAGVKLLKNYSVLEFRVGGQTYGMYGAHLLSNGYETTYVFYRPDTSFIKNGRTYIPLRLSAEMLGTTVAWDGRTQTVYINGYPDRFNPPADAINIGHVPVGPSVNGDRYYNLVYGV